MPEASAWFETTQESYAMEQSLINREEKAQHHLWGDFVPFFLFAVAFRSVLLIIDPQPRFFLGDSESYLFTAWRHWIPNDRSWLYGLFINSLFVFTHSLTALIILQSLATAGMCAITATFCRTLEVSRHVSWIALVLLSIDPMLLYYDRSILTECLGTVTIWLAIVFSLSAFLRNSFLQSTVAVILFYAAICLRTALLPLVIIIPLVLFLFACHRSWSRLKIHPEGIKLTDFGRSILVPGILIVFVPLGMAGYAWMTGLVTKSPPSLNPKGGTFMIGVVAPILSPEDFADLGVKEPAGLLKESNHTERYLRNWQVFAKQGIAKRLENEVEDWREVSRIGKIASRRAILRNPFGFIRLFMQEAKDYMDISVQRKFFPIAFGLDRLLPESLVESLKLKVREHVAADLPVRPSVVQRWLQKNIWGLPLLSFLSVLVPAVVLVRSSNLNQKQLLVARVVSCGALFYTLSIFAVSTDIAPRYLLPMSPMLALLISIQLDAMLLKFKSRANVHPEGQGMVSQMENVGLR